METPIDPSPHLALINRVSGQLGLRGSTREEAFSEGLVIITEAAQTFDPSKGPLVNWLANNIRWGLIRWLNTQRVEYPIETSVEPSRDAINGFVELNAAVSLAKEILTPQEYQIIMWSALEYSNQDIAKSLGISPGWCSRLKEKAQRKLRQANE